MYDQDNFNPDDLIGRFYMPLKADMLSGGNAPPTPEWNKLMYETPGDVSGEVLATLTMVPEAKKDSLAQASLIPETIDASVEVTVVGLTREPYHP